MNIIFSLQSLLKMVLLSYKMLFSILLIVLLSVELYSKPAPNGKQPAKSNDKKEEQYPSPNGQRGNKPLPNGPGGNNPPPKGLGGRNPQPPRPPTGETRPPCDDDSSPESNESHEHRGPGPRHGDRHGKGKGHGKHHRCKTTVGSDSTTTIGTTTTDVGTTTTGASVTSEVETSATDEVTDFV
uniref:Secreted protein n=1 Tax=Strongyloides venezuelensis TaxID=75913 RepID=A0A0K0FCH5_STRVS